jgi:peptidoglycan/xylan/chitin deacetylase (PgdA/CDA1 family)
VTPARNDLAFFRLLALALPEPPPDSRALRPLDRHQSAFENYALSLIAWLTTACYVYAAIPNAFGAIIALPVAPLLLHLPFYVSGLLLPRGRDNRRASSTAVFAVMLAASAYFATSHSWVRFVAWIFMAMFPINLLAGLIVTPASILVPNNEWLGPVVSRFATDQRQVWLTIDDGPTSDTHALLDLLDARGVRATFFVKGMLATPALIEAILARGHSIGNHTQTHPSATFWCASRERTAREIDGCAATIPPTRLFRAPVGHKNRHLHPLLASRGLHLVGFSARAYDAIVRNPERIAKSIAKKATPGAIVVLHQGRPWSLDAIARTIDAIRARGYSFVIPSL